MDTTKQTETKEPGRYRAETPVEYGDNKTRWVSVGSAFVNKDGSINLYLDCLPINGKVRLTPVDKAVR